MPNDQGTVQIVQDNYSHLYRETLKQKGEFCVVNLNDIVVVIFSERGIFTRYSVKIGINSIRKY